MYRKKNRGFYKTVAKKTQKCSIVPGSDSYRSKVNGIKIKKSKKISSKDFNNNKENIMLDNLTYGRLVLIICIEIPFESSQITPRIIIPQRKVSIKASKQHVRNLSHHESKNEGLKNAFKKVEHLNLANYQKIKTQNEEDSVQTKRRNNSIQVSVNISKLHRSETTKIFLSVMKD